MWNRYLLLLCVLTTFAFPLGVLKPNGSIQLYATTVNQGLVISQKGNVGIGTANPTEKLDISGKIALDGVVIAYRPTSMDGTLILGDGGNSLSHLVGVDGWYNTLVGFGVGNAITTGFNNTAMGYAALFSNTTGRGNSAMGFNAGFNVSGDFNVFIGHQSDIQGGLTLQNATAIGYNAKVATSNALILGGLGANAVRVGIGTATPSYRLEVVGTVNASAFMGNGAAITGTKRYYTIDLIQPLSATVTAAVQNIIETGNVTMVRVYTKDGSSATLTFAVEKSSTIQGTYSNLATVTLAAQPNLDTSLSGPVNGNDYLKINMTSVTTTEVDITIIIEVTKN